MGLVATDRAARDQRIRDALQHPVAVAASMLGVSRVQIYRLRAKYKRALQTASQEQAVP